MAHFLQALAALALLQAAAAQAAPFSHQTHLQLKLPCVACHATAPASTRVEDNNLPKAAICNGCHTGLPGAAHAFSGGPQIKAPRPTLVAKFSHQQHVKLGNIAASIAAAIDSGKYLSNPGAIRARLNTGNACAACHRGLETSTQVSKAAFPRMADCLVCHNQLDPPYSCSTCHVNVAALKPATHKVSWLDLHSSGKANLDKASCAVCHGRKFTCLGCH